MRGEDFVYPYGKKSLPFFSFLGQLVKKPLVLCCIGAILAIVILAVIGIVVVVNSGNDAPTQGYQLPNNSTNKNNLTLVELVENPIEETPFVDYIPPTQTQTPTPTPSTEFKKVEQREFATPKETYIDVTTDGSNKPREVVDVSEKPVVHKVVSEPNHVVIEAPKEVVDLRTKVPQTVETNTVPSGLVDLRTSESTQEPTQTNPSIDDEFAGLVPPPGGW